MKRNTCDFSLRVRIPQDLRDWLFDYAERNHTSMSGIVKMLLTQEQKKDVKEQYLRETRLEKES